MKTNELTIKSNFRAGSSPLTAGAGMGAISGPLTAGYSQQYLQFLIDIGYQFPGVVEYAEAGGFSPDTSASGADDSGEVYSFPVFGGGLSSGFGGFGCYDPNPNNC